MKLSARMTREESNELKDCRYVDSPYLKPPMEFYGIWCMRNKKEPARVSRLF